MMSDIPQGVVVAGLAGSLLALIVATAQQQWRGRVFFLLALRLSIGWQFMSEGMNKIESHLTGPAGTSKPFSSEAYFRESEGPLGGVMRTLVLDDPEAELYDLTRAEGNPQTVGDVLGAEGLAAIQVDFAAKPETLAVARAFAPPAAAAADAADYYAKAVAALPIKGAGAKFLAAYPASGNEAVANGVVARLPAAVGKQLQATADKALAAADAGKAEAVTKYLDASKRTYARWVLGLDAEASKKKYVSGDMVQTVPGRLAEYERSKSDLEQLKARRSVDLGRSTLFASIAEAKSDLTGVRKALVTEAKGMIADAEAELAKTAGVTLPAEPVATTKMEYLDAMTMWMLAVAGGCLFFGLGTRFAAVVCGGFLLMTYLTYPPLPWLPNPPGTEGNPVFINKNAIEMFACFALAFLPTGLWMGVDAVIYKLVYGDRAEAVVA